MEEICILGLQIIDRIKENSLVQPVLSKYANIIKYRLGFHELSEEKCSREGLIILQLKGDKQEWDKLEKELYKIELLLDPLK